MWKEQTHKKNLVPDLTLYEIVWHNNNEQQQLHILHMHIPHCIIMFTFWTPRVLGCIM